MVIEIGTDGSPAVIGAHGELDLSSVDQLRGAVNTCLAGSPPGLVIDCRRISFVDSSGIRTLLEARQAGDEAGISLIIVPSDRLLKVAATLGLTDRLNFGVMPDQA